MIRLLIVLAVIGLAAMFLFNREGGGQKPEVQYIENTSKAEALEKQMQEQAAQQLQSIDDGTQ